MSTITLAYHLLYYFNRSCTTYQNKIDLSTTMTIQSAIVKTATFHLPYNYIVLYNSSVPNRTYTTPVPL